MDLFVDYCVVYFEAVLKLCFQIILILDTEFLLSHLQAIFFFTSQDIPEDRINASSHIHLTLFTHTGLPVAVYFEKNM